MSRPECVCVCEQSAPAGAPSVGCALWHLLLGRWFCGGGVGGGAVCVYARRSCSSSSSRSTYPPTMQTLIANNLGTSCLRCECISMCERTSARVLVCWWRCVCVCACLSVCTYASECATAQHKICTYWRRHTIDFAGRYAPRRRASVCESRLVVVAVADVVTSRFRGHPCYIRVRAVHK